MKKSLIVCIMVGLIVMLSCCASAPTWQEQYNLGMRYLNERNYDEAVIAFTAAIEIEPKQAPAYAGRGDAYMQLAENTGNDSQYYEKAAADYREAVDLDENQMDVYMRLGNVCSRLEDYDGAVDAYSAVLEHDEGVAEAYVGRGDAYMQLAENAENGTQYYENAAADYREAIQLDENQIDVYMSLGKVCSRLEDYDGAIDAYSSVLEHGEGVAEVYVGRGDAYMQLAENAENGTQYYENAAADYRKAIQLDENQTDVYMSLGNVCSRLEDYDGAIEAYNTVLEREEGAGEAYAGRGNACYEKARALTREGDLSDSETYHAVDQLYEQAKQDYLMALELGQNQEDVYINLADIYYMQRDTASAVKILSDGYDRTGSGEIKELLDYLMANRSGEITITGELFSNEREYAQQNEVYKNEYGYTVLGDGNLMSNVSVVQYGVRFSPPASVEVNGASVSISEAAAVNGGVGTPPTEGVHEFTGYFTYIENYSEVMISDQGEAPYTYYPNGPYIFWITAIS